MLQLHSRTKCFFFYLAKAPSCPNWLRVPFPRNCPSLWNDGSVSDLPHGGEDERFSPVEDGGVAFGIITDDIQER